jgi:hypothetical protein
MLARQRHLKDGRMGQRQQPRYRPCRATLLPCLHNLCRRSHLVKSGRRPTRPSDHLLMKLPSAPRLHTVPRIRSPRPCHVVRIIGAQGTHLRLPCRPIVAPRAFWWLGGRFWRRGRLEPPHSGPKTHLHCRRRPEAPRRRELCLAAPALCRPRPTARVPLTCGTSTTLGCSLPHRHRPNRFLHTCTV